MEAKLILLLTFALNTPCCGAPQGTYSPDWMAYDQRTLAACIRSNVAVDLRIEYLLSQSPLGHQCSYVEGALPKKIRIHSKHRIDAELALDFVLKILCRGASPSPRVILTTDVADWRPRG